MNFHLLLLQATRFGGFSSTMCIVHKGFRGFRALSPASNLGGNLIGLKPAIPYAPYTQRQTV